jgi:Uma2 family endonuclease
MVVRMFPPELVEELPALRRLSRKDFNRMAELGIFGDEHVELLHGLVVTVSPQGRSHLNVAAWLAQELSIQLGHSVQVRPHSPVAANEWSQPEPDVAITHYRDTGDDYPNELLLVVEVANTSLRRDRNIKLGIYATMGIPEYWIVDVNAMTVEVFTQPTGESYGQRQVLGEGDTLRPTQLPTVAIPVAAIRR